MGNFLIRWRTFTQSFLYKVGGTLLHLITSYRGVPNSKFRDVTLTTSDLAFLSWHSQYIVSGKSTQIRFCFYPFSKYRGSQIPRLSKEACDPSHSTLGENFCPHSKTWYHLFVYKNETCSFINSIHWGVQNFKIRSRDSDHVHFRGNLSCDG